MINIFKELHIEIWKGLKLLFRVIRRKEMLAFSLAILIVLMYDFTNIVHLTGARYILFECSSVVALTCAFLYLFDFLKWIKNFCTQEKSYKSFTRVSVSGKK